MYLTSFGRVGKSLIRSITGVQQNYKETKSIKYTSIAVCMKCPFFEASTNGQAKYCHNYCEEARKVTLKTTYYNEANRFKIPVKERLSKSQLKQILLYHFLEVDNRGVVKNISTKEIAAILGCDVKTINNNNERLVELNYILFSKVSNDSFNVLLLDYKNYHLTSGEGGSGYLTMSKELLLNLITASNVNSLRLELRSLIKYDDRNIGSNEFKHGEYKYNEIKRFLPRYLHYKGAINEVIGQASGSFVVEKENEIIKFKLAEEYTAEFKREEILNRCDKDFDEYIELFDLNENELFDIYQMSVQYGVDRVRFALDKLYDEYENKYIFNLGGLLRRFIRLQNVA